MFHLVGNAGNDDASAFGDFIYSVEITIPKTFTDSILYFPVGTATTALGNLTELFYPLHFWYVHQSIMIQR